MVSHLADTCSGLNLIGCEPPPNSDSSQAFACFSNALSIDPRNPDTLLAAASLYKSCGLLPEAARSLELALEERPDDAVIRQALAVVLTDLGMPVSSIPSILAHKGLTCLGLPRLMLHGCHADIVQAYSHHASASYICKFV